MKPKGIIFDMDGVLVDNRDIHIEAFGIFCARYGSFPRRELLMELFGKGNEDIMPAILPPETLREKGIATLADEKEAVYREIFEDRIQPAPGLVEFLEKARQSGVVCAVGSSGPRSNVDFVLDRCGIGGYFLAVVDGDMVTLCKPDPEIFLTAAGMLGLRPQECIVIEDAYAGIEAARRAGMECVALSTTYPAEGLRETSAGLVASGFRELCRMDIIGKGIQSGGGLSAGL